MSGDVTKLPRWAQGEIDRLSRNVDYWQTKATAGPANSDTFVRTYGGNAGEVLRPLGTGVEVVFALPSDTPDERVRLVARLVGDRVEVNCETRGFRDHFTVRPWAANVIHLEVRDRP